MTNQQRTDLIERHIREHKYAHLRTRAGRFSGLLLRWSRPSRPLGQLSPWLARDGLRFSPLFTS